MNGNTDFVAYVEQRHVCILCHFARGFEVNDADIIIGCGIFDYVFDVTYGVADGNDDTLDVISRFVVGGFGFEFGNRNRVIVVYIQRNGFVELRRSRKHFQYERDFVSVDAVRYKVVGRRLRPIRILHAVRPYFLIADNFGNVHSARIRRAFVDFYRRDYRLRHGNINLGRKSVVTYNRFLVGDFQPCGFVDRVIGDDFRRAVFVRCRYDHSRIVEGFAGYVISLIGHFGNLDTRKLAFALLCASRKRQRSENGHDNRNHNNCCLLHL